MDLFFQCASQKRFDVKYSMWWWVCETWPCRSVLAPFKIRHSVLVSWHHKEQNKTKTGLINKTQQGWEEKPVWDILSFCFVNMQLITLARWDYLFYPKLWQRFEVALCDCVCVDRGACLCFALSDANWRSTGGREGHLRAAVVVEFAHPGAAHHATVGVRSSVCLPVPETPDVALWTDRRHRVGERKYSVRT